MPGNPELDKALGLPNIADYLSQQMSSAGAGAEVSTRGGFETPYPPVTGRPMSPAEASKQPNGGESRPDHFNDGVQSAREANGGQDAATFRGALPSKKVIITVGSTTNNPQSVEVEDRNRDISDAAMSATWPKR